MQKVKLTRGDRFKDARTVHNRHGKQTIADVVSATGVSKGQISEIESDNAGDIRSDSVVKLAKHYGVSADYLLGLSDNPTRDESVDGACKCTGLSLEAVIYLQSLKESGGNTEGVSAILEAERFHRLIKELDDMAFSLEQLYEPINFLSSLNEPIPEPQFEDRPDGNRSLLSGDPVMYSRMVNSKLDLKEYLTELRVQLFELGKLWPDLLEEIIPTEATVSTGKDLSKKFGIR